MRRGEGAGRSGVAPAVVSAGGVAYAVGAYGIAVALFGEPFTRDHAVAFGCVWLALALFSADSLRARPGRLAALR